MYTRDVQDRIEDLQDEYEYLNKCGTCFTVDYNIEFSETINFYYRKPLNKIKLCLQEQLDRDCPNIDYSDFYEQKKLQYEKQVKVCRERFQESIDIFENNCKELAEELGKDFDSFLTEDIIKERK